MALGYVQTAVCLVQVTAHGGLGAVKEHIQGGAVLVAGSAAAVGGQHAAHGADFVPDKPVSAGSAFDYLSVLSDLLYLVHLLKFL